MRNLLLSCLLCCSACIVPAPSTEAAPERQRPVMADVPPLQLKSGANLGDKIEITGLIVQPGMATPGEAVKISAFYKVLENMDTDYLVFVHVEDVDGKVDRLNADHPAAGGVVPTSKWKKGETIRDDFQVYVPPAMQVRGLNLLMGFWDQKTDARLPLKNVDQIRHDGNNRILVGQIPVQAQ
jgi:hypothetical protein